MPVPGQVKAYEQMQRSSSQNSLNRSPGYAQSPKVSTLKTHLIGASVQRFFSLELYLILGPGQVEENHEFWVFYHEVNMLLSSLFSNVETTPDLLD